MVDWSSATADASAAERATAFVPLRVPGSPDTFKEAAVADFLTKSALGKYGIGTSDPQKAFVVSDAGTLGIEIAPNDGGSGQNRILAYNRATSAYGSLFLEASELRLLIDGTERVRLSNSGHFIPATDNVGNIGVATNRWNTIYAATGTINTSDARTKREIGPIPETWLDAWGDVQWCRFQYVDGKRWHTGLIAQEVYAAFAAHGLDAFEIGLCCFDEWGDAFEDVFAADGKVTGQRQTQIAGDRWGLRYDECQAIEAAWQRRRIAQLEARIAAMEAGQ